MMGKKILRQRLKDMAMGAGCYWQEEGKYFKYQDSVILCVNRFAGAIRESDLPIKADDVIYSLGLGWCEPFDNLDELTNAIWQIIKQD